MNRMNQDLISDQILLPDGSVNLNKINLISGAITAPLVRMVYDSNVGDMKGVQRMHDIFSGQFFNGEYQEMYDGLAEMYEDMGYRFPADFALIRKNRDALEYFLQSFLLDYEDIMEDYRLEPVHYAG